MATDTAEVFAGVGDGDFERLFAAGTRNLSQAAVRCRTENDVRSVDLVPIRRNVKVGKAMRTGMRRADQQPQRKMQQSVTMPAGTSQQQRGTIVPRGLRHCACYPQDLFVAYQRNKECRTSILRSITAEPSLDSFRPAGLRRRFLRPCGMAFEVIPLNSRFSVEKSAGFSQFSGNFPRKSPTITVPGDEVPRFPAGAPEFDDPTASAGRGGPWQPDVQKKPA